MSTKIDQKINEQAIKEMVGHTGDCSQNLTVLLVPARMFLICLECGELEAASRCRSAFYGALWLGEELECDCGKVLSREWIERGHRLLNWMQEEVPK